LQKQKEFIDAFTMVDQASNRHIQLVMNNLNIIIWITWLRKNLGFRTDAEISATGL